jgi:hypothetical protein
MRKLAAWLADTGPVVVLALIAGAGSFDHIRETALQHGQRGPMSWAIAVCIDLTCVMAARERHRDKRVAATRALSWPVVVLALGVLLSLAANLDQAQATPWGRITAATPAGAFLTAISMLERRSGRSSSRTDDHSTVPSVLAVPDGHVNTVLRPAGLVPEIPRTRRPVVDRDPEPDQELIDFARQIAADHYSAHGTPITRDVLRSRLGVSNQLASQLLHDIRNQAVLKEVSDG